MTWDPNNNHFNNFGYDRDINSFCRTGNNSPNSAHREDFVNYINDGDTFLDVGCGSAADWEILVRFGKKVKYKGLDYANSILEATKKLYPELEFELADINNLQEKDNSWDVVSCRHVIDHCEYYEQPIRELLRVAKKKVIITMWVGFPDDDTDAINKSGEYNWLNRYGKTKFMRFLNSLPAKVETFEENHKGSFEIFIVLNKNG